MKTVKQVNKHLLVQIKKYEASAEEAKTQADNLEKCPTRGFPETDAEYRNARYKEASHLHVARELRAAYNFINSPKDDYSYKPFSVPAEGDESYKPSFIPVNEAQREPKVDVTLPYSVSITVPTLTKNRKFTDEEARRAIIQDIKRVFATLYGGFTAHHGACGYALHGSGDPIEESVDVIKAYSIDPVDFKQIEGLLTRLWTELDQENVLFTLDGGAYLYGC